MVVPGLECLLVFRENLAMHLIRNCKELVRLKKISTINLSIVAHYYNTIEVNCFYFKTGRIETCAILTLKNGKQATSEKVQNMCCFSFNNLSVMLECVQFFSICLLHTKFIIYLSHFFKYYICELHSFARRCTCFACRIPTGF